jgi:CheY-like chemotaxis protein
MPTPLKFLVIDDNADSRFLLVKTLLRKFPTSVIHECQSSEAALEMAKTEDLAAIISHRTTETAGITLLREIRAINTHVPMVMVSGVDRTNLALAAGADRFLLYDEWLRIGTIVDELIAARSHASNPPQGSGPR